MSMMDHTEGMLLLAKCLDPRNTTMMTEVVKILAAMSIVNEKAWVDRSQELNFRLIVNVIILKLYEL